MIIIDGNTPVLVCHYIIYTYKTGRHNRISLILPLTFLSRINLNKNTSELAIVSQPHIIKGSYLCSDFQKELNLMKNRPALSKFSFAFAAVLFASQLSAQSVGTGSNLLFITLLTVGVFLLIAALLTLTNNFLQFEATKHGIDVDKENIGILPSVGQIFGKADPQFTSGSTVKKLKKGFDINLVGEAPLSIDASISASTFAMSPPNFSNVSPIPKVEVAAGDEVKAGDILFYDKKDPRVKYVSPVSGEVVEIKRGQKRSISDIIILADKDIQYKKFDVPALTGIKREALIEFMLESGVWSMINQRPFDEVADPSVTPTNIFISSFDSAPLAPDNNFVVQGRENAFHKGIEVLHLLTDGQVHIGLDGKAKEPNDAFISANAAKTYFSGPHPAGNVGVQIHHTAPIGRTDKVWTLGVQDVITIGDLFLRGIYNAERVIAIGGAELNNPTYVKTYMGANIGDLVKGNIKGDNVRLISGDVLSGKQKSSSEFLDAKADQITVVKEGNEYELFGWLLPLKPRPSISKTIPSFFLDKFEVNTNTHGEKRAFVMSGEYESVLPMDIYPTHLMKAIMAGDFERMEGLGINELSEEDIAICEFVCTSKMPLQEILRDGLDMMQEQG